MKSNFLPWHRNGSPELNFFSRLQSDFDRALHEVYEAFPSNNKEGFSPSCELVEDDKSYLLKFDIPGVKKEDVKIELNQNVLTVSAERRQEITEDRKKRHYSELNYGSYLRSFTLPASVEEKSVDARFDNGVLTVKLPKTETTQAKQIAIQ